MEPEPIGNVESASYRRYNMHFREERVSGFGILDMMGICAVPRSRNGEGSKFARDFQMECICTQQVSGCLKACVPTNSTYSNWLIDVQRTGSNHSLVERTGAWW